VAMLSLISEQAIPNVMAALLVNPRPRTLVCLLPEDKERKGQVDREFEHVFNGIRDALGQIAPDIQVLNWTSRGRGQPVNPYNADQVKQACQAIRRDPRFADVSWVYNITGGTKVMAQATLDDARANNCRALYVDTEYRRLIWDGENPVGFDEEWQRSVGVKEYLTAYGVEVTSFKATLADDLRQAARLLCKSHAGPSLVQKVKGSETPRRNEEINRSFGPNDLSQAEQQLLLQVTEILSGRSVEVHKASDGIELSLWTIDKGVYDFFWQGRWLEGFVFDTVCRLGQRDSSWRYNLPWRNVALKWAGIEFSGLQETASGSSVRPKNELDVAATRGARLLVCECKTGKRALDPGNVYKLQVIGHKLGTFADKVLVTDRPALFDPPSQNVVRALTLDIVLVQASQLPALDEILSNPEKELQRQKRLLGLAV